MGGQVLFTLTATPQGVAMSSAVPNVQLLQLLASAIEDVRLKVIQERLAADQKVQVVPAGAIKLT
jgi:hypothetical protein